MDRYELRVNEYAQGGAPVCIYSKTFDSIYDAIHAATSEYAKLAGEDQCIVTVIDAEAADNFSTILCIHCGTNPIKSLRRSLPIGWCWETERVIGWPGGVCYALRDNQYNTRARVNIDTKWQDDSP